MKEVERLEKGIMKAKELDQIRNRQIDQKIRNSKPVRGDFCKDLWSAGMQFLL